MPQVHTLPAQPSLLMVGIWRDAFTRKFKLMFQMLMDSVPFDSYPTKMNMFVLPFVQEHVTQSLDQRLEKKTK